MGLCSRCVGEGARGGRGGSGGRRGTGWMDAHSEMGGVCLYGVSRRWLCLIGMQWAACLAGAARGFPHVGAACRRCGEDILPTCVWERSLFATVLPSLHRAAELLFMQVPIPDLVRAQAPPCLIVRCGNCARHGLWVACWGWGPPLAWVDCGAGGWLAWKNGMAAWG